MSRTKQEESGICLELLDVALDCMDRFENYAESVSAVRRSHAIKKLIRAEQQRQLTRHDGELK